MDPFICCLLGICCPPAERRQKVVKHLVGFGIDEAAATNVADDLIARIDQSHFGALIEYIVRAARGEK